MTMTSLAELADAKLPPAGIYYAVLSPSAEQRSLPTWGCATEPLRLSWSSLFLGKQVEELIGGQGIDLYSADSCGWGAHLEPNREFVLCRLLGNIRVGAISARHRPAGHPLAPGS